MNTKLNFGCGKYFLNGRCGYEACNELGLCPSCKKANEGKE
jgi:hypothetical protein